MGLAQLKEEKPDKEDVLRETSDMPGLMGHIETLLRKFRSLMFGITLTPLMLVCTLCIGVAVAPGIVIFQFVSDYTQDWGLALKTISLGWTLGVCYLTYGITLIFTVPLFNFLLPLRVKPWRGIWFSLNAIPWYVHNALTYLVRYTFLEFVTPTPLNVLFYRMMGMKIGKGVVINTTNISDPALITLEDYVTVGGSATIFAHYGQKGYLIISPVRIGKGSTIGLKASIMGGVSVGEKATILPHTVLLPRAKVEDGETVEGVISLKRK